MRHLPTLLLDFLLSLLCALLTPLLLLVWLRRQAHERDVLGSGWEPGTDCDDADVPILPVVTETINGHTVTWTWKTK